MSWDVLLLNIPSDIARVDELPKDFSSELGARAQVLSTLKQLVPAANFADPSWVVLSKADFVIEFNIGDDDPVASIMLHVRGGDGALAIIQRIYEHTGWRAFDTSTGDFINFAQEPTQGLREWRAFRDRFATLYDRKNKIAV